MAQISKRTVNKKVWRDMWGMVMEIVNGSRNMSAAKRRILWMGLLTPTERVVFAKRWMAGLLLVSGWSEVDVARTIQLSTATVYKWSEVLRRDDEFRKLLAEFLKNKRIKPFAEAPKTEGWIMDLLGDIMAGYHDRSRLLYGKIPREV